MPQNRVRPLTPEDGVIREVNQELRRQKARPLGTSERGALRGDGHFDEVLFGRVNAADLAETVLGWREEPNWVPAEDPKFEQGLDETEQARRRALSLRVAERASEGVAVRVFREIHLSDGLLEWDGLEKWLLARTEPRVAVARVLMDPEAASRAFLVQRDQPKDSAPYQPHRIEGIVRSKGHMMLPVRRPDGTLAAVPMRAGAIVDGADLAEGLAGSMPWDRRQAFVWLFTGVTPLVALLTAEPWVFEQEDPWRVQLEVDADVDPRAVESALRAARGGSRRKRPTTTRRGWEAAAWCMRHPEGTWEARMRSFNRAYPGDAFNNWRVFRATALKAIERLPLATARRTDHIEQTSQED